MYNVKKVIKEESCIKFDYHIKSINNLNLITVNHHLCADAQIEGIPKDPDQAGP